MHAWIDIQFIIYVFNHTIHALHDYYMTKPNCKYMQSCTYYIIYILPIADQTHKQRIAYRAVIIHSNVKQSAERYISTPRQLSKLYTVSLDVGGHQR